MKEKGSDWIFAGRQDGRTGGVASVEEAKTITLIVAVFTPIVYNISRNVVIKGICRKMLILIIVLCKNKE